MSLVNYPTIRPSLILDFQKAEAVDPRITFTRATTATRFNSYGVLESVAANVPRIDFDPSTLVSRGLLIEEQRTNIAYPSNMPTSTVQTLTGTMQANGATQITSGVLAPDASTSGFTVSGASATTNSSGANNIRIFAITSAVTYTVSMWIKSNGSSTTVTVRDASTSTASNRTTTSNWTRQSFTFTSTGVSNIIILSTGGAAFDCFGVQVEVGAFATSYIPTTTTALTRNADVADMTGTNFSSWYNAAAGTIVTNFAFVGLRSVAGQRIITFDDGSSTNLIAQSAGSTNALVSSITDAGSTQMASTSPATTFAAAATYKMGFAYALNNSVAAVNATIGTVDSACTIPTGITTLRLAASAAASTSNCWFQRLSFYPTRLPDATLQALTV